jgi:hypothetical protein
MKAVTQATCRTVLGRSSCVTAMYKRRAQMGHHESTHAIGQSRTPPRTARAEAKITVQSSEAKFFDQTASPALMEIRISETFNGDIEGESTVRALQVLRDDQSASLVSVQRFRGTNGMLDYWFE